MSNKSLNENQENPKVFCPGCKWAGNLDDLLDDEGKDAFVCPQCGTIGWRFA